MKKTKRLFIALLSFCLMGNMLLKAEETADGFVYVVEDGVAWIVDYTGASVESLCFPLINGEKVGVDFSELGTSDLSLFSAVETVDLTNVKTVWESTFKVVTKRSGEKVGFTNLKKVIVGDNITITPNAFSGTTVTELGFSGNVASNVADLASTVTTVDLSSVTTIADGAFEDFEGLTSVDLSNVTSMGTSAFKDCTNLSDVTFPAGLTVFPASIFSGCAMLNSVPNLENATEIGAYAFYNCTKLEGSYSFSEALLSIGAEAFMGTNVSDVTIESDPEIGNDAFSAAVPVKLSINNTKLCSNGYKYDAVTYKRAKSGTYGAIVLPFNFKKGNNKYYTFTSYDAVGMHFVEVAGDELSANVPYLYTGDDVEFVSVASYQTEVLTDVFGSAPDGWTSNGVYTDHSSDPITDNGYMWAVQGGDLKWFENLKIKPYRAYWQTNGANVSQKARVLVHSRDGGMTSISMAEIEGLEDMVPVYYDLTGRQVLNPVKGNFYIVNGKKMLF